MRVCIGYYGVGSARKKIHLPGGLVLTLSRLERRSLSLNWEAILFFPERYIILYILSCAYTNIYYSKDPKPWKCRLTTLRPIERRRGKLSLEFFLTSAATPFAAEKLDLVGGGGVSEEVYYHHHQLLWVFNVDTFLEKEIVRATYLFFFSIHKEMKT